MILGGALFGGANTLMALLILRDVAARGSASNA